MVMIRSSRSVFFYSRVPRAILFLKIYRMEFTRLCIVTAVELEFKVAAKLLQQKSLAAENGLNLCRGTIGHKQVTVLQSQMGAVGFAPPLAEHLSANRYDALLIAGLAGALAPQLKAGDAVIYNRCHDARTASRSKEKPLPREKKASIVCNPEFSRFVLATLQSAGLSSVSGAGVTVAEIVTEAERKMEFGKSYESVAIDLETSDVLDVCREFNLPATALRVVSDEASLNLPNFNRARRADGGMDGLQLAQAMLARPLASLRFLRSLRTAKTALRRALTAILNAKWCDQ